MKNVKMVNGKELHKRYALHNFGLDQMDDELEWSDPEIVTDDPREIAVNVGGCENDDKNWCVEIYWADEYNEFVEGSDFDSATHFYNDVMEDYGL